VVYSVGLRLKDDPHWSQDFPAIVFFGTLPKRTPQNQRVFYIRMSGEVALKIGFVNRDLFRSNNFIVGSFGKSMRLNLILWPTGTGLNRKLSFDPVCSEVPVRLALVAKVC
jgi:hypothetical protein